VNHTSSAAVICGDEVVSHKQFAAGTGRLAAHLHAQGIRAGDRLALLAPNCVEVLQTISAAGILGAVVVPMNTRLRADDMRFQVDDADARFAIVHEGLTDVATAAGILDRPHWIMGHSLPPYDGAAPGEVSDDSVLLQLYTSGTTGRPKGCLLTQAGWRTSSAATVAMLGLTAGDVVATPLPLFHVAGLDVALATLAVGGTVVLLQQPDPSAAWEAVSRHGATVVQTLRGYRSFLRAAPTDLGRLRGIFGLSAWVPELDALPMHIDVWCGFGATELCGYAIGQGRASLREHPGTVGRLLPGYEARVVDEAGRAVHAGQTGELLVRGAAVTPGYWNLPEASAEALHGGWLHTGDLVSVSDDGVVRWEDRLKDMVKTGGENVYCIEVETVLSAHPAVSECAVFGVPDRRWGEAVKAVVATRSEVTVEELDSWCLQRLAAYKRPRWYAFVGALPRNALEKVVKTELRATHDPDSAVRVPERT
jgi:acyl-CoA synthetase (AMP-forming)/AMP-acid ligase II